MKKTRIVSLIILGIAVFISVDLGLNLLYCLVPEFSDGYVSNSILQRLFGIFTDSNWSIPKFYKYFETSVWISFLVFVENIVLTIIDIRKCR